MSSFVVPTVFKAIDKMSGPISGMSKKMDDSFARMERRSRKISKVSGEIANKTAVAGAAIVGSLGFLVNEAVKFEDVMADVAKVANVTLGSLEFDELGEQAKRLGVQLGIGSVEAANLMAGLAQGGVSIENLEKVSTIAGQMGVAFGISGELAGESFMTTKNALGANIEQTEKLMDVINTLGNATSASSDKILTFMAKSGSAVSRSAKTSASSVAAFGAELISNGKSAEESATIMKRFSKSVLNISGFRKTFDEAGGGADGMLKVLENGLKSKDVDAYFKKFGEYGMDIQLLASNTEALSEKLKMTSDQALNAGSVFNEFSNRTQTASFKLEEQKAKLKNVAITLGNTLIPVMTDLMKSLTPMVDGFQKWAKENKGLLARMVKFAAVLGGLLLVVSAFAKALTLVTALTKAYRIGVVAWSFVVKIARAVQMAWNAAMLMNPIGLVIAAVAALAAGIYLLVKATTEQTHSQKAWNDVSKRVNKETRDQRAEVKQLFKTLRKADEGSRSYIDALKKIEKLQPGITDQYNLQVKSIEAITAAENMLMQTIKKRAQLQAAEEITKEKAKIALEAEESRGEIMTGSFFKKVMELGTKATLTAGVSLFTDENFTEAVKDVKQTQIAEKNAAFEAAADVEFRIRQEMESGTMPQASAGSENNTNIVIEDKTQNGLNVKSDSGTVKTPTPTIGGSR